MKVNISLILILSLLLSCKKDLQTFSNGNKEIAIFEIGAQCQVVLPDSLAYVDSVLIFYNLSHLKDTTNPIFKPSTTFRWDFGDHTISTNRNPTHKYTAPGTYSLTLYTYLNNQLSDSSVKSLRVIMGLREFRIDTYNIAIDIDQANEKGALVLFQGQIALNGATSFGLFMVDSLLQLKWVNQIAGDINTVRLSSLKRIDNNGYILSGNFLSGNTNQFCISKIDNSGSLIWNKYIANLNGMNTFTTPVSDGGFLTVGDCFNGIISYSAIVKCDANGDEVWRKAFDTGTVQFGGNNIIETDSGYVFASLSSNIFPHILLTQLDFNGNIIKQTPANPPYPVGGAAVGVLYLANAFFIYTTDPGITNYVYFFNNDLSFSGSKYFSGDPIKGGFIDGNYFGYYTANGQYSEIGQLANDGTIIWEYLLDPIIYTSCSSLTDGAGRFCRKAIYSTDNEIVAVADGENKDNGRSLYIVKLNADGKVK